MTRPSSSTCGPVTTTAGEEGRGVYPVIAGRTGESIAGVRRRMREGWAWASGLVPKEPLRPMLIDYNGTNDPALQAARKTNRGLGRE